MVELTVVMPVYNEGERIYRNLIETVTQIEKFCPSFMIIAVNDGSSDGTHLFGCQGIYCSLILGIFIAISLKDIADLTQPILVGDAPLWDILLQIQDSIAEFLGGRSAGYEL